MEGAGGAGDLQAVLGRDHRAPGYTPGYAYIYKARGTRGERYRPERVGVFLMPRLGMMSRAAPAPVCAYNRRVHKLSLQSSGMAREFR